MQLEIDNLVQIIQFKDKIILLKEDEITKLTEDLKKEKRKLKWTKLGWVSTSVLFSGLLVYFVVN